MRQSGRQASVSVKRFHDSIEARLGVDVPPDKLDWLETVLKHLSEQAGAGSPLHYIEHLTAAPTSASAWESLAHALSVPETYFFRNREQFEALRDVAWMRRLLAHNGKGGLRILSSGCATGEEPYSIAMALAGMARQMGLEASLHIDAFDMDPEAIEKARAARYSDWSLRETPVEMRQTWFRAEGRMHVLDDRIKNMVRFQVRNLSEDDASFWVPEFYDIIFCRNVLMYFSPAQMKAALNRLTASLAEGGFLFLGHAESLRGLTHEFHLHHTNGAFYYERKPLSLHGLTPEWLNDEGRGVDRGGRAEGHWMTEIGRAAERVRALTADASAAPGGTPAQPKAPPRIRDGRAGVEAQARGPTPDGQALIARARALFSQERFHEVTSVVRSWPPDVAAQQQARLVQAMLLVHEGEWEGARALCDEALSRDEFDADVHHILALCREGKGDRAGAMDSDQTAAYLDPGFAVPHLHLGLMARRHGELDAARVELALALQLLRSEDDARIELFGGGFGRDTLCSLCRAELHACGGS